MRKIPEPNAKVHHLIPQAYMLRFSPDQKHVHVFDRLTGKYRFSGTRQVAAESEFNTVINNQGKKERWVEGRLSELDSAVSLFDKLERGEQLTRTERRFVAFFASFGDTRSAGFRQSTRANPLTEEPDDEDFMPQFAEAFAAISGVYLDPHVLEGLARDEREQITSGFEDIGPMIATGFELARYLFWAEWLVGTAPPSASFITSDRPLGLIRHQPLAFGDDPFDPRLIKALPLSPRAALFIQGDPQEPSDIQFQVLTAGAVAATNKSLALRADRSILGASKELVQRTVIGSGIATA